MKTLNELSDDTKARIQRKASDAIHAGDPGQAGVALLSIVVMLMKEDPDFINLLQLLAAGDFAGVDALLDK